MERLKVITTLAAVFLAATCFGSDFQDSKMEKIVPEPNMLAVLGERSITNIIEGLNISDSSADKQEDAPLIIMFLEEVEISAGLPASMKECLSEAVKFPEFAREQGIEGVVVVSMFFDSNGYVRIRDSYSNSELLKSYVLERISTLQPKSCTVWMGKEYVVRFLFRII